MDQFLQNKEHVCLAISVGCIVLTSVLVKIAKFLQAQILSKSSQVYALEFLSTLELLAVAFELGVVLVHHGFPYYAGLLIILLNYWGSAWPPANVAPHPHIVDFILGTGAYHGRRTALLKILAQLAAATVVYTCYVKPLWSFGFRDEHLKKVGDTRCFSNLKTTIEYGFLTEYGATFVFLLAGKFLGPKTFSSGTVPLVFVGLKKFGMPFTGCFMNPILASTIQFNCDGTSFKEHLIVYWMGPTLAVLLFKLITKYISSSENETKYATTSIKSSDKSKMKKTTSSSSGKKKAE